MHPTTYIIPEWRVIWHLLTTANLPLLSMPVASATGHASLASKRSPTQRHMHNYSLPSPSSSTTPRPTRSQSSHTLSDFRQAVYIPVKVPETKDDSLRGPRASRCDRISRDTTGMETPCTLNISPRSAASIRATASDPSISLFAYFNEEEPLASHTGPVTPSPSAFSPSAYSVRRMITASGSPSPSLSSSTSPPISPTASSPRRLGMSPLSPKDSTTKMNLVSPLSIPSLTFPLPTPPGLSPDYGWDDDPFVAVSSSFADAPRSKWSPTSSSLCLAHVPKSSDNGSKKNESPPEKFKGDTAAPTKLKDFFGRLNINRSPITSGFHFRSWSQSTSNKYGEAQEKRINRPNSLMAFFIVDEEKESTIKNTTFTHSDDTCIFEPPTLYPDSHAFGSGERDFCSEVADALRLGRRYLPTIL
ncbi:hypothetical protein B0H11DRAFT_1102789 [Mycena galericulata]|nr:hypothetical protein B0H11DRAFT_1102789 [Mycena galericulata]